jgi:hypothetical protein
MGGGNLLKMSHIAQLALAKFFVDKYNTDCHLHPINPGGTLGLFFEAQINGMSKFIKTHLREESIYRYNLEKEITILQLLYSNTLQIERIAIDIDGTTQTYLISEFLDSINAPPEMSDVTKLILDYQQRLKDISFPEEYRQYTFHQIYNEGLLSVQILREVSLLSADTAKQCEYYITQSINQNNQNTSNFCICHGDFSNKNIMKKGRQFIVIDWEDAFYGPVNYDYYYWLTFFDQRKYYTERNTLGKYEDNCNMSDNLLIMLLVTVIKCFISYQKNSYKKNSLTFDERIGEILALWK